LQPERTLAERLYRLRKDAHLTGDQLAERLGADLGFGTAGRSKVSKIENGRQEPTPEVIRAWALAAGHPEAAEELLDLLADTKIVHTRWRSHLKQAGHGEVQQSFDARTRACRRFRHADILLIPGLLQTPGYVRAVKTQAAALYPQLDVDKAVQEVLQRQDVLYDTSKTFEFVTTEAALRQPPCPPQVMLGQLDRLLNLELLDNVTLAIIPFGQLQFTPLNSFYLLDDDLTVEMWVGKDQEHAGEEAADYHRIFDMLLAEAVTGEDARRLIAAAAEALRGSELTRR
jgi:transcriptional regulator with XRE-family HTH domain